MQICIGLFDLGGQSHGLEECWRTSFSAERCLKDEIGQQAGKQREKRREQGSLYKSVVKLDQMMVCTGSKQVVLQGDGKSQKKKRNCGSGSRDR